LAKPVIGGHTAIDAQFGRLRRHLRPSLLQDP
jgi:hypothetical protein